MEAPPSHLHSSLADQPFHCVICLELVYKPIVQSCGHMFCFWCVHRAMNIRKHSRCPVCRRPYMHFPRVCELLHFMLMKALPEEYEQRGEEIKGMEEKKQVFSPRFLESPRHVWSPRKELEELDKVTSQQAVKSKEQSWTGGILTDVRRSDTDVAGLAGSDETSCSQIPAASTNNKIVHPRNLEDVQTILTVDDFLCCSCKKFLYRPVVLNCGEVFCESCLKSSTQTLLHCPSCGNPHRGGSVLVCLEFHHYLQRAYPIDYAKRKEEVVQLDEEVQPHERESHLKAGLGCDSGNTVDVADCERTEGLLHVAVGCDGCGLFPIVGERYHCRDCAEKIGYDLCGTCYRKGGTFSGRFNQQHMSNHCLEEVKFPLLSLNMGNGAIRLRRQQVQQLPSDLDDYFESFIA